MFAGEQRLQKNPLVFKNDTSLPSSFYLPPATLQESGWVVFTLGVCVSKANFSICIKISISFLLLSNITLPVKAL